MEEKSKKPFDFTKITQEEIDKEDSYKQVKEYEPIDFLKAVVETKSNKEK